MKNNSTKNQTGKKNWVNRKVSSAESIIVIVLSLMVFIFNLSYMASILNEDDGWGRGYLMIGMYVLLFPDILISAYLLAVSVLIRKESKGKDNQHILSTILVLMNVYNVFSMLINSVIVDMP